MLTPNPQDENIESSVLSVLVIGIPHHPHKKHFRTCLFDASSPIETQSAKHHWKSDQKGSMYDNQVVKEDEL